MNTQYSLLALVALSAAFAASYAALNDPGVFPLDLDPAQAQDRDGSAVHREAIRRTADMVHDPEAIRLAQQHGLQVLNLTWEDTARFKGSAVGPNISDMTIQVSPGGRFGFRDAALMPVIRFPNFSDRTGDVDPAAFTLLVGNQAGRPLRRVSLLEYLREPWRFMSKPTSWPGRNEFKTLLAPRDERVLVSAQACFLPVPPQGQAEFNPVLFNYQSSPGNPAVLAILVTREGTSMTIIDNARDQVGWNWGQRLYHNANGQRASLTGRRLSDFVEQGRPGQDLGAGRVSDTGLSMVLLIQVPLKHREFLRPPGTFGAPVGVGGGAVPGSVAAESATRTRPSDVETAVIGHGDRQGPFTETGGLRIERDPRYPVRVTVQFYKATSNGVVNPRDVAEIARQIESVYSRADAVGSLVTEGRTGRITEYEGAKVQPRGWWEDFWRRYETWSGVSRAEATVRLRRLLGHNFMDRPVSDLYLRDLLRSR